MFTVKLFKPSATDPSLSETRGVSATSFSTHPIHSSAEEGSKFLYHVFECEDCEGGKFQWEIVDGVRIYVENQSGKTIAHFHADLGQPDLGKPKRPKE